MQSKPQTIAQVKKSFNIFLTLPLMLLNGWGDAPWPQADSHFGGDLKKFNLCSLSRKFCNSTSKTIMLLLNLQRISILLQAGKRIVGRF
jgi:hypothetical protein